MSFTRWPNGESGDRILNRSGSGLHHVLGLLAMVAALSPAHAQVPLRTSPYPPTESGEPLPAPQDTPYTGYQPWEAPWHASQGTLTEMPPGGGPPSPFEYTYEVLARGYYMNDHRIEWSGQEATFGVEGALSGEICHKSDEWQTGLAAQIFLNQPYNRNMLAAPAERMSYLGNFEIDIFEISQLYLSLRRDDCMVSIGKYMTPFGRYYLPIYTNSLNDAPFIRSESINWRETGLTLQYDPEPLILTAGVVNGCEDMDSNSSKALISRVGYESDSFAMGASIKYQDGIGSEEQKSTNNHIGIDCMYRWGAWVLSGEAIYDEYGYRREFDPLNITWGRSTYYRDLYDAQHAPLTGWGYYANLTRYGEYWTWVLNYGDYYPEQIGVPQHDIANHRGLVKAVRSFGDHLEAYSIVIVENDVPNAQAGQDRKGWAVWCGFQYNL